MRITVVGDGKVGRTLAEQLSRENHDVVVIDRDQQVIDQTMNMLDIMGVCGNGASYQVQKEAGVEKADLLIASTDSDEVNILCCMVAKKLGAKHTIARVRNPEYTDQLMAMQEELGLSMHINPEYAAAAELFRMLRFPSAIKIEEFSNKSVEMAEVRVQEDSPLNGVYLRNMNKNLKSRALICAVRRGDEVFIPGGNFQILAEDKISVIASPAEMAEFFSGMGIAQQGARNVMIIGGSRIAYYLSKMMLENGIRVKIIDNDAARCQELSESLPRAVIIHGDGTDQELLREEGIGQMDAFVTLTGVDEENIILSMYAQANHPVKVITKINRTSLAALVEKNGLESVISPRSITANSIVRYVRAMQNSVGSNVETLHRIAGEKAEALEFRVSESFPRANIPLKDLKLRPNVLVACITRGRTVIIPGGNDVICPGDRVIVATTKERLDDLADILL